MSSRRRGVAGAGTGHDRPVAKAASSRGDLLLGRLASSLPDIEGMEAQAREGLCGVRALVVDDAAPIRELMRRMPELEGATVVEAATAAEGLPDMSGEAVVTFVRAASGGRTPVAMVTGAEAEACTGALEIGA
jgi:hypothetical protein